jgi:hypothetical protein
LSGLLKLPLQEMQEELHKVEVAEQELARIKIAKEVSI